jgi:hypothetical protein
MIQGSKLHLSNKQFYTNEKIIDYNKSTNSINNYNNWNEINKIENQINQCYSYINSLSLLNNNNNKLNNIEELKSQLKTIWNSTNNINNKINIDYKGITNTIYKTTISNYHNYFSKNSNNYHNNNNNYNILIENFIQSYLKKKEKNIIFMNYTNDSNFIFENENIESLTDLRLKYNNFLSKLNKEKTNSPYILSKNNLITIISDLSFCKYFKNLEISKQII